MPTADYDLKIRFDTPEAAAAALPSFRAFVAEGVRAHAWWKTHRRLENQGQRGEFWKRLQSLFPVVADYLSDQAGANCEEGLLGLLEFGKEDALEIDRDGVFFKYRAEVWHGADWTPLGEFVKRKFGALGVDWIGDEPGMDLFTILQP